LISAGKKRCNAHVSQSSRNKEKKYNFSKVESTPRKIVKETIPAKAKVVKVWKKGFEMSSGRKYLVS
jgi:hypothetical protein